VYWLQISRDKSGTGLKLMNFHLKEVFDLEIEKAIEHYKRANFERSFYHLERAHILGQSYTFLHMRSHVWMFKVGWKKRDYKEVLGQITRIIASLLFTRIWIPVGNTGGANVSPFKPMPISDELKEILKKEGK